MVSGCLKDLPSAWRERDGCWGWGRPSFLHLNCHSWHFKIAVISWHFNIYTGNEVTAKGIKGFQDRGISSIVKRMPTGTHWAFLIVNCAEVFFPNKIG